MPELEPGYWHVVRHQEGWTAMRTRYDLGPNIIETDGWIYKDSMRAVEAIQARKTALPAPSPEADQ